MTPSPHTDTPEYIQAAFRQQQQAFMLAPMPPLQERRRQLLALRALLVAHRNELAAAIDQDFGARSIDETLIAEIAPCVLHIDYTLKRLRRWMKPQRRTPGFLLQPSRARVIYQPLGVVGIIVPFNYPVYLALVPLITALAAGNRAMLKMSELTPRTGDCLHQMLGKAFGQEQVAVIRGAVETAVAFTQLPFDHLLFTGSTAIGKQVMREAASNLTPVTLELGGKSPAIIADDIALADVVERLCFAKSLNAGQTCIAPDYVLLPRSKLGAFIQRYKETFQRMYPDLHNNPDYSAIISTHAYQRLQEWLKDAEQQGAKIEIAGAAMTHDGARRMPLHFVTQVSDGMKIMQHELFGPILPLLPYDNIAEAIAYVNRHPRPLALYLFSHDRALQQHVSHHTHAGSMCINEALLQVGVDDMPFGGIGPSGMGQYHGEEGFRTLSKAKSILQKGRFNSARFIYPPYRGLVQRWLLKWLLR